MPEQRLCAQGRQMEELVFYMVLGEFFDAAIGASTDALTA
jgi:hypothetical protein